MVLQEGTFREVMEFSAIDLRSFVLSVSKQSGMILLHVFVQFKGVIDLLSKECTHCGSILHGAPFSIIGAFAMLLSKEMVLNSFKRWVCLD